jgi:hypothetical protein
LADRSTGYPKHGISVLLFDCDSTKKAVDGVLISKFFDYYNKSLDEKVDNIGWHIIDKHFAQSIIEVESTNPHLDQYRRIKFLSPQVYEGFADGHRII